MLDTNIVSDMVENPSGRAAQRANLEQRHVACISIIVASEMRFGIGKGGSPRLIRQVEAVMAGFDILPFEPPADQHYARIRAMLESTGQSLGPNDLFIAAHALSLGAILVTHDAAFSRVPGLVIEDWLA